MTAETDAMRLVPVEPTEAMLWRGFDAKGAMTGLRHIHLIYRAMLSAAPAVQPAAGFAELFDGADLVAGYAEDLESDAAVGRLFMKHRKAILAAISTPAQASETGSALDPVLFDHAWKMVQAIRGGGTPPFLTPTEAADKAATYLLSRLDERNALSAPQAAPGEGEQS